MFKNLNKFLLISLFFNSINFCNESHSTNQEQYPFTLTRETIDLARKEVEHEIYLNKIAKGIAGTTLALIGSALMYRWIEGDYHFVLTKDEYKRMKEVNEYHQKLFPHLKSLTEWRNPKVESGISKFFNSSKHIISNISWSLPFLILQAGAVEGIKKLGIVFQARDLKWYLEKTQLFELINSFKEKVVLMNHDILKVGEFSDIQIQNSLLNIWQVKMLYDEIFQKTIKVLAFVEYYSELQAKNGNQHQAEIYRKLFAQLFNILSGNDGLLSTIEKRLNANSIDLESSSKLIENVSGLINTLEVLKIVQKN